jgi:hypothetical protein
MVMKVTTVCMLALKEPTLAQEAEMTGSMEALATTV